MLASFQYFLFKILIILIYRVGDLIEKLENVRFSTSEKTCGTCAMWKVEGVQTRSQVATNALKGMHENQNVQKVTMSHQQSTARPQCSICFKSGFQALCGFMIHYGKIHKVC